MPEQPERFNGIIQLQRYEKIIFPNNSVIKNRENFL